MIRRTVHTDNRAHPTCPAVRAALLLVAAGSIPAYALNLAGFTQCLSTNGTGAVCQLDPGTYSIASTLFIGRSNVTIKGTIVTSRRDTILQRAPGFHGALLRDVGVPSPSNTPLRMSITVRDLTIDGNRNLNSDVYGSYQPEVDFFATSSVLIANGDFINSPNISVALYGAGTAGVVVNNSYFGNAVIYGFWSGPVGNQRDRPNATQQCGGRFSHGREFGVGMRPYLKHCLRISGAGIWLCSALSGSAQTVTATPAQISQAFQVNGSPVTANFTLSSSGGSLAVTVSLATDSGGNWLAVSPASGAVGSGKSLAISVTMDPSGLPDGTFTGNISISPPAPSTASQVPVVMMVGNPGPQLSSVGPVNGASFPGGAVSPGDVVTFIGSAIGPKLPYGIQIQDGVVQPKIAGTRIWFGNTPAPLVYAYPNEVAAVVPASATGTMQIRAENMVARSLPMNLAIQPANSGSGPPTPVSASAIAAAGDSTFNFTFTDPRGWQDLDVVNVLINNFLDGRSACYLAYSRPLNVLYLVNDAGAALLPGLLLNGSGSVSNSQCTVSGAGSSAVGLGAALTLTLNLSFSAGFAGNKLTYLAARDVASGNSGWQALGTRSVPGATTFPSVVGVNPVRGAGSSQTFTFTFSDTKGYPDLGVVNILINSSLDGRQACYLAYSQPSNVLYLVNDSGTALSPGLALNGSGAVSNGQCTVNSAGSSSTVSGNTLSLTLNINFTAAFAGNRVIYMAARDSADANNSGWQTMGTWTSR